jgi:LPXTG-motif cell wall-anchored protein
LIPSFSKSEMLGINPEEGSSAALVENGKLRFYTVASSAAWREKLAKATIPTTLPTTGVELPNMLLMALVGALVVLSGLVLWMSRARA